MKKESQKEYYLEKYRETLVTDLINRKLIIHKQLERPSRSYVVYSDLHGSYEKYLHWLKNGLGHYQIAINQVLGQSYNKDICDQYIKLLLSINRTRLDAIEEHIAANNRERYPFSDFFSQPVSKCFIEHLQNLEKSGITRQRILEDIMRLLREITKEDEHRIIKVTPPEFLENILKLFFKKDRPSYYSLVRGITENDQIYPIIMSVIVKLTLVNMFDKHINLGDTFDRGNDADKLIALYRGFFGNDNSVIPLHYIWGNHDILWLGASIGNPILCATALRISMRYNNVEFLYRYGFNLDKLRAYANKCYKLTPTGIYAKSIDGKYWSKEEAAKMAKVLLIIEEKLTTNWLKEALDIPGQIDYQEEYDRHSGLLKRLPTGIEESEEAWKKYQDENPIFLDVFYPTIDPNDPSKLTPEEQEIADDITNQFMTLPKLQEDLKWMFDKGETYRVVDNTLYFHAAIPSTKNKELYEVKGYKGKALLDFVQQDLKRIGELHQNGEEITLREKMLLWHLWCGKNSPFFCKSKMATLERSIFDKEVAANDKLATWTEVADPYYANIRDDVFLSMLLSEFHATKVCMGHTPVKEVAEAILSDVHGAFIVDGGASDAYGDKGAVLINTPDYTYLTMHPSLQELKEAEKNNRLPELVIQPLEQNTTTRIRHIDKGFFLKKELEAIDEIIDQKIDSFTSRYFY